MWRDEIRLGGVWRCFLSAPIPLIFLSHTPLPAPPWPVLWATCGTVAYCFLWQAKLSTDHFIFDVGRQNSRRGGQSAHTHTNTHWVQGNIIQEEEEFPNDQTQAAWWVFASPLLCFLCLFFRSPSLYLCLSFISILPTPALYWYLYFCLYWLSRFSFSEKYFYLFFLLLLSVFLFPSCFTVFYCFCLGFNFLFTLSVQSVCLSLSL